MDGLGLVIGAVFLAVWYFWHRSAAKLVLYRTEWYMEIVDPVPLCGAPDVVWRSRNKLIVGDYKSRSSCKVYPSDKIQLSVYRLLLKKNQKMPVADYGFIHFANGRKETIKLYSEKEILQLVKRYSAIRAGKIKPEKKCDAFYCRYCSHQGRCKR
ncbi:MAG: PD-(D/E)XK nuclease family protein [Sporomusaceae bacterium]|nr:PD-(D/E)XK nuclease family protein [Sporomusaceae bacterium]